MRINGTSFYSSVLLDETNSVSKDVQVLRTGKFNHPSYGEFEITSQVLSEMKANFDARVRGVDIAFDYFHESEKEASGWVKELQLREDGQELWAVVDWTPKAKQKLADRELRYFSPDFSFQWTEPENGTIYKNVLFGGALTNRPFVKEMKAIVANEQKGENMNELEKAKKEIEDLKAKNLKLSEDKLAVEKKMEEMAPAGDKVKELEAKIAALQAELEKEKASMAQMAEEKKNLEEQKVLAEKEKEFNVLLSEGKACAAQKDAFIKGDMKDFIAKAQKVNLNGSGSTETNMELSEVEKVLKLADEKQKADPKLDRGTAVSLARKELAKK